MKMELAKETKEQNPRILRTRQLEEKFLTKRIKKVRASEKTDITTEIILLRFCICYSLTVLL